MKVHFDLPENGTARKDFIVCLNMVEFLDYDYSNRLLEWLELLFLLGADHVWTYWTKNHPNVERVFKYYERKGKLSLNKFSNPGPEANHRLLRHFMRQTRRAQTYDMYLHNNCLYRNMYKYQYAVIIDADEVIMPLNDMTWKGMLLKIAEYTNRDLKDIGAISFRQALFLDTMFDVMTYIFVLRVNRAFSEVWRFSHFRVGFIKFRA